MTPIKSQGTSIDEAEIAKFSAMAEEWWDINGKFKPLHQLNPVRIAYIRDTILSSLSRMAGEGLYGITILDIGCGGGLLAEPLAQLGANVTGIDASEKNIRIASLHAEQEGITINYRHTSAESLTEEGKTYDVVLAMEIIEHVADVASFMQAVGQLVKPGGLVFVATLNRTLKSLGFAIIGAEYLLRWVPRGTHDWNKFMRPSEIAHHFAENGITLQEIQGVAFNPLKAEWTLSKDLAVNYMMVGKK